MVEQWAIDMKMCVGAMGRTDIRNILVMSSMGIGDFIMFTPVLRALRGASPDARIDVWFSHGFEADLWRLCPYVREARYLHTPWHKHRMALLDGSTNWWLHVVLADVLGALVWLRQLAEALLRRYDTVITHYNCSNRPDIALAAFVLGCRRRVGYADSANYPNRFAFCYNLRAELDPTVSFRRMNLSLLHALGCPTTDERPEMYYDMDDRRRVEELLAKHNPLRKKVCIVAPGVSFFRHKRWPTARFTQIANWLAGKAGLCVLIVGTGRDAAIRNGLSPGCVDLVGKLTIGQVSALVERAELVVCCEGGIMHMADAHATKAVALYGPQNTTWAKPFHHRGMTLLCQHRPCAPCNDFRGHHRMKGCSSAVCMEGIGVEDVKSAISGLLGEAPRVGARGGKEGHHEETDVE